MDAWLLRRNVTGVLLMPLAIAGMLSGAAESERSQSLDPVVVTGRRTLAAVSAEIDRLEDQFYERYNELNSVRDFDVHCGRDTRTGTRLDRRTCRIGFEIDDLQEEGAQAFRFRQYVQEQASKGVPNPTLPGAPPIPAIVRIEARRPEFQENLRRVVSEHPELQGILKLRAEEMARYERMKRKRAVIGNDTAENPLGGRK
jgi:hypothetical protein